MYKDTVGIIGGFGAYATLNFYEMILKEFASDSERNYPHLLFDNNFTMPSRTRALLYGDDFEGIVDMISQSMKNMLQLGADHIILVCGTAHFFLKDVYKKVPEAEKRVINMIELTKRYVTNNGIDKALIVAAEGTLKKRVYETVLGEKHCVSPGDEYFSTIRTFIEAVKTDKITDQIICAWNSFLHGFGCENIILGCTELPILVNEYKVRYMYDKKEIYNFIDPMYLTINELKRIIK